MTEHAQKQRVRGSVGGLDDVPPEADAILHGNGGFVNEIKSGILRWGLPWVIWEDSMPSQGSS